MNEALIDGNRTGRETMAEPCLALGGEDAQCEHEGEDELVALKEPPLDVQVDVVRHELDDVHDALGWDHRLLTPMDSRLVQCIELQSSQVSQQSSCKIGSKAARNFD